MHAWYGIVEPMVWNLRVCLVGGVEKWEDRKYFNFSHFSLVGTWKRKSEGMKQMSLHKFTRIPLLKNDAQLKQKSDKKLQKKKKNHPIMSSLNKTKK